MHIINIEGCTLLHWLALSPRSKNAPGSNLYSGYSFMEFGRVCLCGFSRVLRFHPCILDQVATPNCPCVNGFLLSL